MKFVVAIINFLFLVRCVDSTFSGLSSQIGIALHNNTSTIDVSSKLLQKIRVLRDQIEPANLPLFGFQRDMTSLLITASSIEASDEIIELEAITQVYLSQLRDYYLALFESKIAHVDNPHLSDYADVRQQVVIEFSIAINATIPSLPICKEWHVHVSLPR